MSEFKVRAGIVFAVAALMVTPLFWAPLAAHAEGEDPDAPARPKVAHHKVVKKKPVATAPAGPIPYTTLNPGAAKALPAFIPPPPPPPPPAMLAPQAGPPQAQAPQSQAPQSTPPLQAGEINLKCDTVTSNGKRNLTRGTFYIDLFPSPVFPDQQADFKFDQVAPGHASLVRDSDCLDTMCDAKVSAGAYFLVNRVTRKGAALRITLNRADGAFYAETIDPKGLVLHPGDHIGESGWCVPQKLSNALF